MKNYLKNIGLVALVTLSIASCSKDDATTEEYRPSSGQFAALKSKSLNDITQHFTMTAENGTTTFTSAKGVQITISGACLTLNGNPITGQVDIEYAEVFDAGKMLTTDKTTMGKLPNGDMALILSGGEFYINAKKSGQQLAVTCPIQLVIPATLTGGLETGMSLWDGAIDTDGNLDWKEQQPNATGTQGVFGEGQGASAAYYAFLSDFGWTNVDRFYSDPRPKTTILASAPSGYNFQNSAVYLHYDGEGSALAKLDTFNSSTQQFSEHYGQIPIGLACHVIFVTEDNGNWRYAIKPVTIAAGDVFAFTLGETTVVSQAQLESVINALP